MRKWTVKKGTCDCGIEDSYCVRSPGGTAIVCVTTHSAAMDWAQWYASKPNRVK